MRRSEGEIVRMQRANGNRGARGYFIERVDLMLANPRRAEQLFRAP
jgi:hypothetical protein